MEDRKIALVTGARKGIGFGVARALVRDGYFCVITGRGKDVTLEEPHMAYLPCDNLCLEDIRATVKQVCETYGRIDLLVNNAGVAPKVRLDILETTEESYDFVMDTNLKGAFFMTQAVANAMVNYKREHTAYTPRIVNITSMSAYTSSTNRGEYCISKAGLSMVTALFADRLAPYGIPVFEVRPGIIRTDMTAAVTEKYQRLIDGGLTPVPRMGEPEDVAECVSAAASGKLDFATGQVLNADGGFHLRRL